MLLVGAHLTIFRHNGGAGPPVDHDLKRLPQGRFWPNQMFMDAILSFAVFVIIVLLSIFIPAGLDAKADPTQTVHRVSGLVFFGAVRALALRRI